MFTGFFGTSWWKVVGPVDIEKFYRVGPQVGAFCKNGLGGVQKPRSKKAKNGVVNRKSDETRGWCNIPGEGFSGPGVSAGIMKKWPPDPYDFGNLPEFGL